MKDALVFGDETFVAAHPPYQVSNDDDSFLLAVSRITDLGMSEVKPRTDGARVDVDMIFGQRSSLH